jgi:yfiE
MNNKKYGLNFDFITLRVKNIEKMKDFYVKLLKMKILKDSKKNRKREVILGTELKEIIKMVYFGNEILKSKNEAK